MNHNYVWYLRRYNMSKTAKKGEASKKVAVEGNEYVNGLADFWKKYSAETSPRVKLIDWFTIFLLAVIGAQFFYRIVVGDDFPKNAFLTGIFCPLGVIILLVTIRQEEKDYRKLGEFFLACLVLFIVSINFVGWFLYLNPSSNKMEIALLIAIKGGHRKDGDYSNGGRWEANNDVD